MIIECPNCGTKYTVKEEAIKPGGRTVRCSTCAAKWHADKRAVPTADAGRPEPESRPEFQSIPEPEPDIEAPLEEEESGDDARERRNRRVAQDTLGADARFSTEESSESAVSAPARGSPAMSLGLLAASLALLLLGGWALRDRIAAAWPATARLYNAAGLARTAAGEGLALTDVHARLETTPKGKTLTIEAVIADKSAVKRAVPPLKASLVSASGAPQRSWEIVPGEDHLAPAGTIAVKASFDGIGAEDGKVLLTFSSENNHALKQD